MKFHMIYEIVQYFLVSLPSTKQKAFDLETRYSGSTVPSGRVHCKGTPTLLISLLGLSLPASPKFGQTFLSFLDPLPDIGDIASARLAGNINSGMLISRSLTGFSTEELVELDLLGIDDSAATTSFVVTPPALPFRYRTLLSP